MDVRTAWYAMAAGLALGLSAWGMQEPDGGPSPRLVPPRDSATFRYADDDGPGRLIVSGAEPGRAGESAPIRVTLIQNGTRLEGSGTRVRLEDRMPQRTVYAFAIQSPRAAYFFEATVTSGVTVGGSGTYHRVGNPGRAERWSITLGGK